MSLPNFDRPSLNRTFKRLVNKGQPVTLDPDLSRTIILVIDIEAWERDRNRVTELGLAVLRLVDVAGLIAGDRGTDWMQQIHTAHFRVAQNMKCRNGRWVADNADHFLFGRTQVRTLNGMPGAVDHWLYSITGLHIPQLRIIQGAHDARQDRFWMQKLGMPWPFPSTVGEFDTQMIAAEILTGDTRLRPGFTAMADALGVQTERLHNAGNDAHFELCALVAAGFLTDRQVQRCRTGLLPRLHRTWYLCVDAQDWSEADQVRRRLILNTGPD